MSAVRDNWRIALLVVALLVSLFLLFGGPLGGQSAEDAQGPVGVNGTSQQPSSTESALTNLKYGLDLSGGTRIQAPLVGWTAEDVDVQGRNTTAVELAVAGSIGNVSERDVAVVETTQRGQRSVALEVRAAVSREAVVAAVEAANLQPSTVRPGVTPETRSEVQEVLQDKIDETGIQGGQVRMSNFRAENRWYAIVEVPNANTSQVESLIQDRGSVRVYAYHQANNGTYVNRTVLTNDDFANIEPPELTDAGPRVPVTIRSDVAPEFQEDMVETGIASQGGSGCGWPGGSGSCMLIVRDGQVVGSFGMEPRLAASMQAGTWANDPIFVLPTENYSQARELSINLRAGELPTRLDLDDGTGTYVSPSFGQSARLNAILTALIAVLAVTGVVVYRYGEVRVAVPMVLTALAEVVLLLGFASGVGLALDLSHIAGFIAVIGTGVDDLVIIADDILQQGSVATDRVFKSRFRKALWVIGVAAATTIVAMSPLAVLGLQQLRGFAIVTIVGVLLGVLVTRPAYGDILRHLVMNRDD